MFSRGFRELETPIVLLWPLQSGSPPSKNKNKNMTCEKQTRDPREGMQLLVGYSIYETAALFEDNVGKLFCYMWQRGGQRCKYVKFFLSKDAMFSHIDEIGGGDGGRICDDLMHGDVLEKGIFIGKDRRRVWFCRWYGLGRDDLLERIK